MIFHSLQFMLFLPLVFALYWALHNHRRSRQWLLLLASFIFYMAWNPAPVVLILYLATTDYFLSLAMQKSQKQGLRKLLVTISLFNNLGILAVFKYADWFTQSVVDVAAHFDITLIYKPLGLVLPVGLSFVVFQTLSYTIDVYRKDLVARKSWLEVTLYISFFPQIVAGPIVRAIDFLPQLDKTPTLDEKTGAQAFFRIASGMFKKLVIADLLAANLVDRVFADPSNYTGPEVLAAAFAYTVQIYYDFSAYSDIAIGSAALFGFHIKENFDKPYLSTNLFEFWRRWHISLGRWLFDYLYVPLGGNKKGKIMTLWNLWVVMLLGSVWHGADWRFVVWGVIHGGVLIANRILWWKYGRPKPGERPVWITALSWLATFLIVMEARVVFRAANIQMAWQFFLEQFKWSWSAPNLSPMVLTVLALAILGHLMTHSFYDRMSKAFVAIPIPARAFALMALVLVIKKVADFEVQPFIYFQF